ncbi:AraC family transcriptional regulator [uncultured Ralstonia sp.]|jgi:AraC-like DNA-binding protein|uniref:AraC family transcriptional regulator n=2 Tax=Ralstonia TaxID=48736 RepID=UPI0025D46A60|nr:AraC family transcriptional regulator [uncultured Ralstonia sp.]
MTAGTPLDRLSGLLERFRVRARLFYSGALCGVTQFTPEAGQGFLHVLRRGELEVTHPNAVDGLPTHVRVAAPCVLFYPRPAAHSFHNPPVDGSDFTCATLDFDGGALNPLARGLPALMVLPLDKVEGLEPALALLFAETDRVRCGQRVLADRLFDVVCIQLLRWLLDHPEEAGIQPGLIAGLSDLRLARAMVAVHGAPGAAWTLDAMAVQAGMSRSAFAAAFKQIVGQTPADYVVDWRVSLAQTRLREGRPIKLLAEELGYAGPSALSRVFKERTGVSPRDWRKQLGLA